MKTTHYCTSCMKWKELVHLICDECMEFWYQNGHLPNQKPRPQKIGLGD